MSGHDNHDNGGSNRVLGPLAEELLSCSLGGDERAALRLARTAVVGPEQLVEFYRSTVTPLMYETGRLWEAGDISAAQEHLVTSIITRVVSVLYSLHVQKEPSKPLVVFCCAPGEEHSLGARLAADAMEVHGWDVDYVGASAPLADMFAYVAQRAPFILAISISMERNLGSLLQLVQSVQRMPDESRPHLLVGGRLIEGQPEIGQQLQPYDAVALTLEGALQQSAEWLRTDEQPVRGRQFPYQSPYQWSERERLERPGTTSDAAAFATVARLNDELERLSRALQKDRVALQRTLDEQRKIELRLRLSEETATALLDGSQDAMALVDAELRVETANAAMADQAGVDKNALRGSRLANVFLGQATGDPELSDDHLSQKMVELAQTTIRTAVAQVQSVECAARHFELRLFPVSAAEGTVARAVLVLRDVTREKQSEELLLRASRLQSAETLASGAAHELNNLLAGILGYTETLQLAELPRASMQRALTGIREGTMRAAELAKRMLEFATGGIGKYGAVKVDSAVNDAVSRFARHLAPEIEITLEPGLGDLEIASDRRQLGELIEYLLRNAEEAIDSQGRIRVSTFSSEAEDTGLGAGYEGGGQVVIRIEDTGKGMDARTAARALEPFFSTKVLGRGLGLSAAYGIARAHGGQLVISSEPGAGTQVDVCLGRTATGPWSGDGAAMDSGAARTAQAGDAVDRRAEKTEPQEETDGRGETAPHTDHRR